MNEYAQFAKHPPTGTALRIPPQNLEAEQAVLGSILLKDKSFSTALELITPADFYKDGHRIIFEAMIDLFEKNEPYDLLTISNHLKDLNRLDEIGGIAYLSSLTSIVT